MAGAARVPITATRLRQVGENLTVHEQTVLETLATVQVMTTAQVARFVFGGQEAATALRLARRHLERLRRFGLVRRFDDRARDRRVGVPGYVHALTAAGLRLCDGQRALGIRQRTGWRPSYPFLTHRLGISELFTRLGEREQAGGPRVREFQAEPSCWRRYLGPAGERLVLKPDALVRVGVDDVEVSTFCEIDLGAERPATIASKCRAYRGYELSSEEQRQYGVFPGALFIVPSEARARAIAAVIRRQPPDAQGLFAVATEEQALAALARADETYSAGGCGA